MTKIYRVRRTVAATLIALIFVVMGIASQVVNDQEIEKHNSNLPTPPGSRQLASEALENLDIKGRSPKTGYSRDMFGNGWRKSGDCDTRNDILARDLRDIKVLDCKVYKGTLDDPYTAKTIVFTRGAETSDDVQIDHVVALSDAWQKGAQLLDHETRENMANDPLELLAVDGRSNEEKGASDAASWLPPNKKYRCRYVARQIAVKQKYNLWVTSAEFDAISRVLGTCPEQVLPTTSR